jgi:hypothetical protein
MSAWHGDISGAANELSDAADLLLRAATDVETALRERARLLAELGGPAV